MARLFVEPTKLAEEVVVLADEDHRYLTRVLRLDVGAAVTLFDGKSVEATARIPFASVETGDMPGVVVGAYYLVLGALPFVSGALSMSIKRNAIAVPIGAVPVRNGPKRRAALARVGRQALPIVGELKRDRDRLVVAQPGDHGLQRVLLFGRYADLVALDADLRFGRHLPRLLGQ